MPTHAPASQSHPCACQQCHLHHPQHPAPRPTNRIYRYLHHRMFGIARGCTGVPAGLVNCLLRLPLVRYGLDPLLGLPRATPLPAFTRQRFTRWVRARDDKDVPTRISDKVHARTEQAVYLYFGCAAQYFDPTPAIAAVQLLEAAGWNPILARHACCGLPWLQRGDPATAQTVAQHTLHRLAWYARRGIPIIGVSAPCTRMIQQATQQFPALNTPDALTVAHHTRTVVDFLARHGLPAMHTDAPPLRVCMPHGCPAHADDLQQAAQLIRRIPNVREDSHTPDLLLHPDLWCRTQLAHHTRMPCQHPLHLLAQRVDRAATRMVD